MNSDDLSFFSSVVDSGSLSAAALTCGCDTSTISRRVAQLEKSVGARLFNRSGRGVSLTPQGRELLNYARQMASLVAAAQLAMRSTTQQGPSSIHIAAQPTIAKVLFGTLFHAIRKLYPLSQIHFTEALGSKILADLQAGQVDIAVMYKPEYSGSLAFEPLLYEKLYLLTPMDSDVTADQVRAHGLAGIPLILPSTHHGLRVLIESMGAKRGYVPHIVLQSDSSTATTLDLIAKGCGCSVKPLAAAETEIAAGRLRGFPLEDEQSERCISLVIGRTKIASGDLWALNGVIRETTTQLVRTNTWHGARLAE
jgi:LysR family transcriptional regulator, nitrogen assimilation regulatory protein